MGEEGGEEETRKGRGRLEKSRKGGLPATSLTGPNAKAQKLPLYADFLCGR